MRTKHTAIDPEAEVDDLDMTPGSGEGACAEGSLVRRAGLQDVYTHTRRRSSSLLHPIERGTFTQ